MKYSTKTLLQSLATLAIVSATEPRCKCSPEDACWPGSEEWAHLNTTISGALLRAIPPASACYPQEPNYSEEACSALRAQWFDSTFHASDPISIDYPIWTNDSCNPIYPNGTSITGDPHAGANGCGAETYPAYVVNATSASQIGAALKWAGKKNIRVVVKATGHSFTGRSTGAGSLSIWTHNLRGMEYLPSFTPTACPTDQPRQAVRVAAGHTNGEIQEYLSSRGRIIVSGANPSVGIMGWLTGGGHGYLSSTYGMGSDNLLEASVVLPCGTTVVASPCQNADLLFALRGGGGGTYGVVTAAVLQTHRSPQTTQHVFALVSLPGTTDEHFWAAMGVLHAHFQRLKDGGMQGYYYIAGPPVAPSLSLLWSFMLFDKPASAADTLLEPLVAYLTQHADLFAFSTNVTHFPSYAAAADLFRNEPVATGGSTYGSRLLSAASLSNASVVAATLQSIGPRSSSSSSNVSHSDDAPANPLLIGHMVAPPSAPPPYYPAFSSLNPVWRDALVHLVVSISWRDGAAQTVIEAVRKDVTRRTGVLRELAPRMGAYFNEADSEEEGWQESFFGASYGRLVGVKGEVDPRGVLWCSKCVGSEAFVEEGGRLCRVEEEEKSELRP